jgi:hypothetical protein
MAATMITKDQARFLLDLTSQNTVDGRIGGPYSSRGYSLAEAKGIIDRVGVIRVDTFNGQDAIITGLRGFGDHIWYLNTTPRRPDPWG